ncbi:hypothetical protein QFW96_06070 [Saccharopolyspora sp. TS4A08]|uniref:Uncharacterized protein n=1 Tax=Saccharopolyspora ipomoeae TaxID=3042027 RepID=A0ABT6PJJ1_9PSEU|nr:hypothetical protein [Saccharopolyspora sp. TS4A08]MDI2028165.1 hypothetical protein [Saccharopolyspora sp. TS4A08]
MREETRTRSAKDAVTFRNTPAGLRYTALESVQRGMICYHNGLYDRPVGYDWAAGAANPMTAALGAALHDLWVADLIDIDTRSNLFAPRGHRVVLTAKGRQALSWWPFPEPAKQAARR